MFGRKRPNDLIYGKNNGDNLSVSEIEKQIENLNNIKKEIMEKEKIINVQVEEKNVYIEEKNTGNLLLSKNVIAQNKIFKNIENIDETNKNTIICRLLMSSPGKFMVKNDTFVFDGEKNLHQVFLELKNIEKKYIKKYNEDNKILTLEIPMKKKGSVYIIVIDVDLTKNGIIDCNYMIKMV
jgi:hypothetical protein